MNKTTKKKNERSFFTRTKDYHIIWIPKFQEEISIATCPQCKKSTTWNIIIGRKKNRLYVKCNRCKAIYMSPKKIVKTT